MLTEQIDIETSRHRDNTPTGPEEDSGQNVENSPPQIWKSRISWRITLTAFLIIMLVQAVWLYRSTEDFETEKLTQLVEKSKTAILQHIQNKSLDLSAPPFSREEAERIFKTTPVKGLTIYSLGSDKTLSLYGEPSIVRTQSVSQTPVPYRSADQTRYEILFTSADLESPYNIVAVLDSSAVAPAVLDHIKQTVIIVGLMSGLVTAILMLMMGQWLLEPLFILRKNLLNAAINPKDPIIHDPHRKSRDEVGATLRVANDLIRRNARNMKQLEKQTADRIHRLAYYDTLTGLPNRTFFVEKLEEGIKLKVMREDKRLVVFSVDIDHFKDINDTMGHEIGDKLLEAVGKRLLNVVPEGTVVSRSSVDEFLIMMTLDRSDGDGSVTIEDIRKALAMPISVLRELFEIRVSVGVTYCPDDGTNAAQIIKNSDIALNRAKIEGRDTVRYYSEDFDLSVQRRFQMLRDLRTAMENGELILHYHPQFNLATGELIGTEALLRWMRPDDSASGGSLVPPSEFIPIAEQSGLIVPIGEWVLKTACRVNKAWQEKHGVFFCMAVNISSVQFHRSNIVDMVDSALRETGLDPKYLELEVTESVFMEDMDTTIDILSQLHDLGVQLSVDDFGTGYSSLNYLRQFPIDRLKIDQSFTRNALINESAATITKAIISLGHSLGLKVIAEGVETSEHEGFLKRELCDEVQGFKYTKPLPAEKFWDFVTVYNANLAKSNLRILQH